MPLTDYCPSGLGEHDLLECGILLNGGSDAIALYTPEANITTFDDPAEYTAAIAAGEMVVISNAKFDWPAGTPATQENLVGCGPDNVVAGYDHTINVKDGNVTDNNSSFYANLNGKCYYVIIFNCSENQIQVIELPVFPAIPPSILPASNKEFQRFEGVLSFSSAATWYAPRYDAPAGIFTVA